jgi:hypothetical protein
VVHLVKVVDLVRVVQVELVELVELAVPVEHLGLAALRDQVVREAQVVPVALVVHLVKVVDLVRVVQVELVVLVELAVPVEHLGLAALRDQVVREAQVEQQVLAVVVVQTERPVQAELLV